MRRFLTLMALAALLAAGCARQSGTVPAGAPGGEVTGSAKGHGGQTTGGLPAGSAGSPPEAKAGGQASDRAPSPDQPDPVPPSSGSGLQTEPAGGLKAIITKAPATAFEHYRIKPGKPIGRTGIFFMKTATGEVDGWALNGGPDWWPHYGGSADNRWVSASEREKVYLLDRKSGTAYQWSYNGAELLAAHGETLLFQTGSRFWVTSSALSDITPVALTPAGMVQAVIGPNDKAAILVNGETVYLLDVQKADLREIGQIPASYNTSLAALGHGLEVVVVLTGRYDSRDAGLYRVQRYDWTGRKLADQSVPGPPQFSPDGQLVAWSEQLLGMIDTRVVGSGLDFTPEFRLVGDDPCRGIDLRGGPWLADGSALVVPTGQGYRLLRRDGSLAPLGTGELGPWEAPVPAPDRADWFAMGGFKVVDQSGRQVAAAVGSADGSSLGPSLISPWGESSDELRLVLGAGGKDYGCLTALLPPQVEKAPFAAITGMEVTVAQGDCVNLRAGFDRTAPVITCMPNGTRLTGATPPGRLNKGYLERMSTVMVTNMGGEGWWFVRTETGRRGWVMLSGEYLTLAAARPGDPPPNRVADLVADEHTNMRYWFSVAAGEAQCGAGLCGGGSWSEPIWALTEWCRQSGPGYIRKKPEFDPARHGDGVAALENGCRALVSAWETLGEPADSPAWRAKVAEVKAGLAAGR